MRCTMLLVALIIGYAAVTGAVRAPESIISQLKQGGAEHPTLSDIVEGESSVQASRIRSGSRQALQLPPLPGKPGQSPTPSPTPLPVNQRVIFNPVRDEVKDYMLAAYAGIMNIAEADPVVAVNSAAVNTGIYTVYEVDYDYDQKVTETIIGPGAKGTFKAAAGIRGIGGTRAEATAQAQALGGLFIDKINKNSVEFTQNAAANLRASLLTVLNSPERRANDAVNWINPFLFEYPVVGFKGRK